MTHSRDGSARQGNGLFHVFGAKSKKLEDIKVNVYCRSNGFGCWFYGAVTPSLINNDL